MPTPRSYMGVFQVPGPWTYAGIEKNFENGYKIRRAATDLNIPLITNARLATAFIRSFSALSIDQIQIKSWDEYKS